MNRPYGSPTFVPSRLETLEDRILFAAAPITFVDGDGTNVRITLAGNGAMMLVDGDLTVTGADQGTRLNITTKGGDGRTTLGSISVSGAVKSITAKKTDFTGDISILGSVRTLTLGDFLAGSQHQMTIGGTAAAPPAKINLGRVNDLSIDSDTPIASLAVIDWDDAGDDDEIEAPQLKKATSKEDFAPGGEIVGDDDGEGYLGKVTVKGMLAGSWYVDGNAAGVTAGGTAAGFRMNVLGKLNKLTTTNAGDFRGVVAAYDIGSVSIAGDVIDAVILAGADLGEDIELGGSGEDADLFFSGVFSKLTVKGTVTNSTFGAGLDPANGVLGDGDDFITGKNASSFNAMNIRGVADADTRFAAGRFGGRPKVGGTTIDPNGDPRFLLASLTPDNTPPVITADLENDTGTPDDNITGDPTIVGRVIDLGRVQTFRFGVDDDELNDFVSIRGLIESDGTFELSRAAIEKANKGPLTPGAHTINFLAQDEIGNTAAIFTVAFVFVP